MSSEQEILKQLGKKIQQLREEKGLSQMDLAYQSETSMSYVSKIENGHHAPGVLRFLPRLERTLHLGRAFHELVEVHRTELAANHPEIALRHD